MHQIPRSYRLSYNPPSSNNKPWQPCVVSRRCRNHATDSQGNSRYALQEIASSIQSDLDRRNLSYEEALNLGNILQDRADMLPGDEIVYAVSDRDSYRRTLELYLKDGVLTQAEQLLLWEERRRLGIGNEVHNQLMEQLLAVWTRQGQNCTNPRIQRRHGRCLTAKSP